MIKVRMELPDLTIHLNTRRISEELGDEMRRFWISQMDKGLQPDGSPLPLNKEGKPMGRGTGKMIKRWRLRSTKAKGLIAQTVVEPSRQGNYRHAYWVLVNKGVKFQSFEGASLPKWEATVKRVSTQAWAGAIGDKRAKGPRIKIREWL